MHARRLEHHLQQSGFELIPARETATEDVVIVHSGGVIDLSRTHHYGRVLLLAPSLSRRYPSQVRTMLTMFWREFVACVARGDLISWASIAMLNVYYLAVEQRRLLQIRAAHLPQSQNLPRIFADSVLVVSYRHDPWSGSIGQDEIIANPNYRYLSLDATHDDLWIQPERYIAYLTR